MADPEIRNTPEKYPTVGALSRLVGRVDKFARAPFGYSNPPVEMLSDLLEIPALYRTGENIAYGSPLTIGAGQARRMTEDTTGAIGGALNLIGPAVSTAKLAVKGAKAAAPRAGALAQQLAVRTQPMPLQMNIVKPQGNLNLTPMARSEILKGPEAQTADSFLNQLRGKPGMTKEGFDELARRYQDLQPNTSMTKAEFEQNIPPSQYSKADLAHAANAADEHMLDEAEEMVMNDPSYIYESVLNRLGIRSSDENINLIDDYHRGNLGFEELSPELQEGLRLAGADTPEGSNVLSDLFHEEHGNAINDALGRLGEQESSLDSRGYAYSATQRLLQNPESSSKGYFEFGVTHPEQVDSYRHYPKYDSYDGGLIGHVRGTFIPANAKDKARLLSNPNVKPNYEPIFAKPNSMVIEEIQADAQKAKTKTGKFIDKQTGILRQSHGTVFKAAIQHALENGATTVYYPTARTIGNVRGKNASPYKTIYDQQIVKEGLNPLLKTPGVSSQKIGNAWYEIDFTPEAIKFILKGEGQTAPGYAKGGEVKKDADQVSDDPIGDFLNDYEMEQLRNKIAENEAALIDLTPVPTRVETGSDPMLLDVYPRLQREMEANPERYEYGTARLKDEEYKRPMLSEDASRESWLEYKLRPRGQTDYSDKYPPGMELFEENYYYPRFGKRQPPKFKDKTPWDGYYAEGGAVEYDPDHIESLARGFDAEEFASGGAVRMAEGGDAAATALDLYSQINRSGENIDAGGLQYWTDRAQNNQQFPEALQKEFMSAADAADDPYYEVNRMYQRTAQTPDTEGFNYWVNRAQQEKLTPQQLGSQFISGMPAITAAQERSGFGLGGQYGTYNGLPMLYAPEVDKAMQQEQRVTGDLVNKDNSIGWDPSSMSGELSRGAAAAGVYRAPLGMGMQGGSQFSGDLQGIAKQYGVDPEQYMQSAPGQYGQQTSLLDENALYNALNDKMKDYYAVQGYVPPAGTENSAFNRTDIGGDHARVMYQRVGDRLVPMENTLQYSNQQRAPKYSWTDYIAPAAIVAAPWALPYLSTVASAINWGPIGTEVGKGALIGAGKSIIQGQNPITGAIQGGASGLIPSPFAKGGAVNYNQSHIDELAERFHKEM